MNAMSLKPKVWFLSSFMKEMGGFLTPLFLKLSDAFSNLASAAFIYSKLNTCPVPIYHFVP